MRRGFGGGQARRIAHRARMRRFAARLAACVLLPFLALAAVPERAGAQTTLACADFLAQLHRKPAHTQFVGCTSVPDRQGKPLRAIYHVSGQFAAQAETYLVKATGLARLRRSCCQWDAPPRQFTANGREFSIAMVSGETPVATRAAWPEISTFEITVETMTEDI